MMMDWMNEKARREVGNGATLLRYAREMLRDHERRTMTIFGKADGQQFRWSSSGSAFEDVVVPTHGEGRLRYIDTLDVADEGRWRMLPYKAGRVEVINVIFE